MARSKNITLFFEYFQKIHFVKDPFLVPYYLGKMLGYSVNIVYPILTENSDLPDKYKGVRFIPVELSGTSNSRSKVKYFNAIEFISTHARDIDVLMLFFGGERSELFVNCYKNNNPRGKVYIKLDINPYNIELPFWKLPLSRIKNLVFRKKFFSNVDVVSCETTLAYDIIKSGRIPGKNFGDKLVFVPNGIDEEEIREMKLEKPAFPKKENVMLTIGRLGTPQKNTDMLLKVIDKLNLRDWKFYMVGPVEQSFEPIKDGFMENHPELSSKVIWTGPINDRFTLYSLLCKSKVFVLTSKWESFALVFVEAQRFFNYIVSTPVGAASDVVKDKYGQLVPIGDVQKFCETLQGIIDEKIDTDVYKGFDVEKLSWENRLRVVADKLKDQV